VPIAISAEQQVLTASIREWAARAAALAVVAERPLGLPRDEAR
jgi:hypothetical protein